MTPLGPAFRALWAGNACGNLADGVAFVTIPLLAVSLTDSPVLIAGLATAYSLTRLLVALPVGVHVDRHDRRILLWTANVGRGVVLVLMGVLLLLGQGTIWVLYAVYCLIGLSENVADNAAVSILPDVVRTCDLDAANSRISTTQLVADEFVGPPLGGLLFGLAAAAAVVVTGALYCLAAAAFLLLPHREHRTDTDQTVPRAWVEARAGLVWMAQHPQIRTLSGLGALTNFAYMVPFSILVLFAVERLGLSATGYGLLLAASSVGGLVGAAVAAQMRRRIGYRATLAASLMLGSATLIGTAVTSSAIIAAALLALYILHATVYTIASISLRQRLVPERLRGRVYAGFRVLSLLGLALGGVTGGVLAQNVSLTAPLILGGVAFACAVLWTSQLSPDAGLQDAVNP